MRFRQILAALLALVMLVGAMPMTATAAADNDPSAPQWGEGDTLEAALSKLKVGFDDTLLDWLSLPRLGVIRHRYTYFKFKNERTGTIDEHPAYCIDPTRTGARDVVADVGPNSDDGSNTATYIRSEKVGDARYKAILAAGYPHMMYTSLGLASREEGYYATKIALWMYIRGHDPSVLKINPAYAADDPAANRVRAAAVSIYSSGTKSGHTAAPQLTLTGKPSSTAQLDANKEYYVQGVEVFASGWVGTDPSGCGDVQLAWGSAPPAGTIVLGSNGEDITSALNVKMAGISGRSGWYGKATIKYPADQIDASTYTPPELVAKAIVPNDEIYTAYAEAGKDKYQRYLVERDPKTERTASFISQLSHEPRGGDYPEGSGLRIVKLEAGTNLPLEGAAFEIRDPDGRLIYSLSTDESGIIDIPLSEMGNYTVTEASPPRFHLLPSERTKSVAVRYGETAVATFVNAPYGSLRVFKCDAANGSPLGGASVRIRNLTTNATQEGRTDSSGYAVFGSLPVGAYEIVELAAPDGYALDASAHTVNVVPLSEGETSYTLTNKANPGLRIVKFDRQAMTPIKGVAFEVWHDGELFGTYRTDDYGEIELRNLPAGTYTAREVATVSPYLLDGTAQWIEIKAGQGHISELYFFNLQKPGISLVKLDSVTLAPLPNARFRVEKVGGSFANEYNTDRNGEISLAHLEPGAYKVTELAAPGGYLIDGATRIIQINSGENAQFVFTNTKKPTIEVVKIDANTGAYLPGAAFRIAKIEDGSRYLDRVTDTNGRIKIDSLEPGVYSVTELAAPEGYVPNTTEWHVELFPGKTSTLVVNNEKKPDLKIVKRDAKTGALLAGASFTVRKADCSTLETVTTDANGEAWLYRLDPGVYEVIETLPPAGYLPDGTPQLVTLFPNRVGVAQFNNFKKPGLTILKVDEKTGLPLAGAEFSVKRKDGSIVYEGLTDNKGEINLAGLVDDWYTVTEIAAPYGYFIAAKSKDVKLAPGENAKLKFDNRPQPILTILKRDAVTGEPLSGVKFKVQKTEGETIGEFLTDADGKITLSPATGYLLEEAVYKVTEIAPPNEYLPADRPSKDVLLKWYEPTELIFENYLKPTLIFIKRNGLTKRGIDGATYRVDYESPHGGVTSLGTYKTKCGLIALPHVLPGWYSLTETIAAPGYALPTNPTVRLHLAPGENSYTYEQTHEDLYVDPRTNPNSGARGACGDWCGHLCSVLCAGNCGNPGGGGMSGGGSNNPFGNMTITNGNGDAIGGPSGNAAADKTAADKTAPALAAGTVTRISGVKATVQFKSSKAGQYYYAVVNDGAAAPFIPTGGLGAPCGTSMTTVPVCLTFGAKDFYVKVKDASGNVSGAFKIDIPTFGQLPAPGAMTPGTVKPGATPPADAPGAPAAPNAQSPPPSPKGGVVYVNPEFSGISITFGNR